MKNVKYPRRIRTWSDTRAQDRSGTAATALNQHYFCPSSNDLSWAKKSQCILHFSSSITKNTTSTLRSPFLLPETTIVVQSSAGDGQNRAGQFYHYDVNTELQNKHNFCFTQHVPTVNWWTFGHRRTDSSCCAIHEKVVSYQHHFANYKYSHRVKSTTQCNVL